MKSRSYLLWFLVLPSALLLVSCQTTPLPPGIGDAQCGNVAEKGYINVLTINLLFSEGVLKGRLSLPRLVELVATAPAVLFGLAPQKGTLFPGADADIVLLDPQKQWIMNEASLHMATDWSAYEDVKLTGKIDKVFSPPISIPAISDTSNKFLDVNS